MAGDASQNQAQISSAAKKFSCPTCDAKVEVRVLGQTVNAVCGSCNSVIDPNDPNYKVIERFSQKGKRTQAIALGTRGTIDNIKWEVIGYMERKDVDSGFMWSEYLLYNPFHGFRWLTESDGHWNFVSPLKTKPVDTDDGAISVSSFSFENHNYRLYHSGTAVVEFVVGEFYWQLKSGESVTAKDYIAPPLMLSMEKNDSEVIWSSSKYIPAKEVRSGFDAHNSSFPIDIGVAPNQPSPYDKQKGTGAIWGLFFAAIIFLQIGAIMMSKNKTVFRNKYQLTPESVGKLIVSEPFEIKNGPGNLEISIRSSINNSWFEVQGELVNDDNGQVLEFDQTLEYYHGVASDGGWSEGSPFNRKVLSNVPDGKYHLNIDTSYEVQKGDLAFEITIKRNVINWANFALALLSISFYPVILFWFRFNYEVKRWQNSDYTPYSE